MALTKRELDELKSVHDSISHVECFSVGDLRLEAHLMNKETDAQIQKVCRHCFNDYED